ncbi:MAG: TIGR03960 family B12-binding radical SAM protein [Deltaproteobacteria bacterium]|nr:TIGR03960 family B12-binding radical SAM protein [Deltaproteobacteria bacterium]
MGNSYKTSILDQAWFSNISRPSRYIGNEINSVKKSPEGVDVSIALAFPDVYEVGMSHLGLKILYNILNSYDWLAAERIFSPWHDLEKQLRLQKIPVSTLESNRPLSSFDIIGFSLQHELSYTNVLNMLDLSFIPFTAETRSEGHPLIIAGGPACFNPEPVADFFDLILIGDGEQAAVDICTVVREAKKNKSSKKDVLTEMRHIKGVYVPSFFNIHHSIDGHIDAIDPVFADYQTVEKAVVPDIDDFPYPVSQIVPFTELIHDRVALEVSRGCTRGCRFCQAGMIYRPVRERSPESILEKAEQALKLTGYDELTLLSLSSGDYSCIEPLIRVLMDRHSREGVALSLPSLRVDSLNNALIEQIKRVRKTGFTLAPEAGSDRLRRIINKGLTEEDILNTAHIVYRAGWDLIKLYFMVGLPQELEKDVYEIVTLARRIAGLSGSKSKRIKVNLSVSTFVPKSHTPFMWLPQISVAEGMKRIQIIREGLRNSRVRVKWNEPELSWLEGIFSRGDRRLSLAIGIAWSLGARFDAWSEQNRGMAIWSEAFRRSGIDPEYYLRRERLPDEILPWDHIRSGVSKRFLKEELIKSQKEELTRDCRINCMKCGVCNQEEIAPVVFNSRECRLNQEKQDIPEFPVTSEKYRLTFIKVRRSKYLSHLELVQVFIRAFKRSGLKLVYSRGFHPMPRIVFANALPVGTESLEETVEIIIRQCPDSDFLMESINKELPDGIEIIGVEKLMAPKKPCQIKESHFLISISGVEFNESYLDSFLRSEYFPVTKSGKNGKREINARPMAQSMSVVAPDKVELVMRHINGPGLKPAEIIKGVFHFNDMDEIGMSVLKTRQVIEEK